MPRRRCKREIDKRLDWRDPLMPVVRTRVGINDFGAEVLLGLELVRPEEIQAASRVNLKLSSEPSWRHDMSYRWAEIKGIVWEDSDDE